ncbi:RNA/RNP complex-1-interacting phosphatase-like isoform X2 [Loxodonta africana]|uniref:RNA/RNP complex-1-interacting phosphatase-like isoform X2 n=1 Tax=Loxodonta africana TaxID=9785 RepID=UPI0030D2C1CC
MAKKNHIPSGWRTVTPIGHPLPGTRFIAFKVPFKGSCLRKYSNFTFTDRETLEDRSLLAYHKDKLIGVHCTNGINRTGYLICRYLIDVEGWDPDTAIQAFGEARGHQIVGCVYLKDLKTQPMRSNLGMDVWDSDEDAGLPSNSMEKSRDWPPDEDLHGTCIVMMWDTNVLQTIWEVLN